jgi:hypothetical protein
MKELDELLIAATAKIDDIYMTLPVDGGPGQFRERVYCYELYHQLRSIWPPDTEYSLNGEVDKRGHPILRALGDAEQTPDLLVHTPGRMDGNHSIIEVKSHLATTGGVRKDLTTLARFRQRDIHYERAIYLIFGRRPRLAHVARIAAAEFPALPRIELWEHLRPGKPARYAGHIGDDSHLM